jgi:hypothetical protein
MRKMVMISYNESIDEEVMDILDSQFIKRYTKWKNVKGSGVGGNKHLGTPIFPGENNVIMMEMSEERANNVIIKVKELRKKFRQEGIKAFSWTTDEIDYET